VTDSLVNEIITSYSEKDAKRPSSDSLVTLAHLLKFLPSNEVQIRLFPFLSFPFLSFPSNILQNLLS